MVQLMLEECCFDFGKRWLPDVIALEEWEAPEQVELTIWIAKLKQHTKYLSNNAFSAIPGKPYEEVLIAC